MNSVHPTRNKSTVLALLWGFLLSCFCIDAASHCSAQTPTTSPQPSKTFRIAGYMPDYRWQSWDESIASNLTDLILFSAEPTADGSIQLDRLSNVPWKQLENWNRSSGSKLWICIGGWERSQYFPAVSATENTRKRFSQQVLNLCIERSLDGVDIDWEHPKNNEESRNYGELLAELKRTLQPRGIELSMTMAAWQMVDALAIESSDWIQIMAYDHPGEHSTMQNAIDDIQKVHLQNVPKEKLVLGLPLYGRSVEKRDMAISFSEIVARQKKNEPSTVAATQNRFGDYFYNGPALIEDKTKWAVSEQLGGVMVWEVGQDAKGEESLLRVIQSTISAKKK